MIEKHNITYLLNTLQQTHAEKFDHHDYTDANLEPQENTTSSVGYVLKLYYICTYTLN